MKLFSEGITPWDIRQGALGNGMCLSTIAALAAWPNRIEKIFSNDCVNPWGVYAINICKNG